MTAVGFQQGASAAQPSLDRADRSSGVPAISATVASSEVDPGIAIWVLVAGVRGDLRRRRGRRYRAAPMIRVRGMEKSYRTGKLVNKVLHGVDLDIEAGQFVAVVGPSGSGKSTLLHALGGLDRDFTGTVEVDGRDLHKLSDVQLSDYRNRDVGFVFQSFNLLHHLSCRENVALPAQFARGEDIPTPQDAAKRAAEMLERVGLEDKVDALPNTLSGGQKQRVAIARALFNRPRLMLCDEPTGNLDSKMGDQILGLFRTLNEEDGITVLIVTHDPRISDIAPRTIRVEDGQLFDGAQGDEAEHEAEHAEAAAR